MKRAVVMVALLAASCQPTPAGLEKFALPVAPPTTAAPVSPPASVPVSEGDTAEVSWYDDEGTASGEPMVPGGLTFAHRTMDFGTEVLFSTDAGSVVATCTDRGPATWTNRDFDLSRAAFAELAPLGAGVATVTWRMA